MRMKYRMLCAAATLGIMTLGSAMNVSAETATFYMDAEGSEVYDTVDFEGESRITPPETPEKEGCYFAGWYLDSDYTTEYKESTKLSGDQNIYAKWLNEYTFEAEYTQLTDLPEDDITAEFGNKIGYGYSNNVSGLQLIQAEGDSGCEASNGYYVSSLYYNGAYLEFNITSDKEVDDAVLVLRLSSEYYDMNLTDSTFLVQVNGEDIKYGEIDLSGAITDMSSMSKRPFTDFTVSDAVHLNEGENTIRLQVNNSEKQGSTGTMNAAAPMVDCIYVDTDAVLTWEPFTSNTGDVAE